MFCVHGAILVASCEQQDKETVSTLETAHRLQAGGFGPLKGGLSISCSSALARRLLASPPAPLLEALGKTLKYEIAVGQNGRIWIDAPAAASAVLIANAIERCEFLHEDQTRLLVQKLTSRVQA
jgi:exosome complex component RRP40